MFIRISNILIPLLMLIGCVEPYEFEIEEGDKRLVVQGRITNEPGPYLIVLTESANYSIQADGFSTYVSGAEIFIIDDEENFEILTETTKGHYWTSETGIRGEIGKSYYLEIQLRNGNTYRSEPEVLTEPSPLRQVHVALVVFSPDVRARI